MHAQQAAFLKALDDNLEDAATRAVYADWLEENGFDDEAARQRDWPRAWAFIKGLFNANAPSEPGDPYYGPESVEELVALAGQALDDYEKNRDDARDYWVRIHCGANEDLQEALRTNRLKFWECWSVVAGRPLPEGFVRTCSFSCSC